MPIATVVSVPVASAVTSAGGVTDGAVVSATVMVCVAVPMLPAASVALQVTSVAPIGNGPVMSGVGVSGPSTLSSAVAVPSETGVVGPVASVLISAGGVTTGGVVSPPPWAKSASITSAKGCGPLGTLTPLTSIVQVPAAADAT